MQKISVSKELFENILLKKISILKKDNSKYWKKVLLEPKIINNKIEYSIKQFDTLSITNGLGNENPSLVIECNKIDYSSSKNCFEFTLGKVIEQKNTNLGEDYKDNLIEQLLKEKEILEDKMNRDHLTNIYNRRKMENDLKVFSKQNNSSFLCSIFIADDRLKETNYNLVNEFEDKVLLYLSDKLRKHAAVLNGEVYRYSEEEFIILCFISKKHIIQKLNDLVEDIKSNQVYDKKSDICITISMGISFLNDCKDTNEMIQRSYFAIYRAKNKGTERIEFA